MRRHRVGAPVRSRASITIVGAHNLTRAPCTEAPDAAALSLAPGPSGRNSRYFTHVTAPLPSVVVICGKGRIAASALSFSVHYLASSGIESRVVSCPNSDDKGYDTWQEWVMKGLLGARVESAARHRKTVEAWPT